MPDPIFFIRKEEQKMVKASERYDYNEYQIEIKEGVVLSLIKTPEVVINALAAQDEASAVFNDGEITADKTKVLIKELKDAALSVIKENDQEKFIEVSANLGVEDIMKLCVDIIKVANQGDKAELDETEGDNSFRE